MPLTTSPTITSATPSDAAGLHTIAQQTFTLANPDNADPEQLADYISEHFSPEVFSALIAGDHAYVGCARHNGKVTGFIVLRYQCASRLPQEPERCAELQRLYVLPDHHGNGIARELVEAAFGACRQRGINNIRLSVFSGNARAKAFYAKFGFVGVAETFFMMGREKHLDAIMVAAID